jgi:hypothetical protein
MKLIGYLQGFAAMREKIEEYLPERGFLARELVELVRTQYEFQAFPQISPGILPQPPWNFVGGKFTGNGDSFGIHQLAMKEDGDVVVTTTTDQADQVLKDLVKLLDDNLGFRLGSAHKTTSYVSNMVVEFDRGFEDCIISLSKMALAINDLRVGMPAFNIKRISFGEGGFAETNDPLVAVEKSDFLIERRSGTVYDANRYFCSAPLPTAEHLRLLERIEAIACGDAD